MLDLAVGWRPCEPLLPRPDPWPKVLYISAKPLMVHGWQPDDVELHLQLLQVLLPYLKVLARREMVIRDLGSSLALKLNYAATKHAAP